MNKWTIKDDKRFFFNCSSLFYYGLFITAD